MSHLCKRASDEQTKKPGLRKEQERLELVTELSIEFPTLSQTALTTDCATLPPPVQIHSLRVE